MAYIISRKDTRADFWKCLRYTGYVTRDVFIWKESYLYGKRPGKRPTHMKRDPFIWKCLRYTGYVTRDVFIWKESYLYGKRPGKRPTHMKRDLFIWKETHLYKKRPTCTYHLHEMKHFYIQHIHEKTLKMPEVRGICQKRPNNMKRVKLIWKETWKETQLYEKRLIYMKRDLFI